MIKSQKAPPSPAKKETGYIMDIFSTLSPGTHIVTPNRRLAADMQERHAKAQASPVFVTPVILPYSTWCQSLYKAAIFVPKKMVSPFQEKIILQSIIEKSEEAFLNINGLVKHVLEALTILHQWCIPLTHPELLLHENATHFIPWVKALETYYEEHQLISAAQLPGLLIEHAALLKKHIQKIYFLGFTELCPEQQTLILALEHQGITCTVLSTLETQLTTPVQTSYDAPRDEIQAMVTWAHTQACARKSVACIVPTLTECRYAIETKLRALCKDTVIYNISAGYALTEYPLIHAALSLLQCCKKNIPIELISRLLRSPFIGEADLAARSLFLIPLLECKQKTFTLEEWLYHAIKQAAPRALITSLQALLEYKVTLSQKYSPSAWALHFTHVLEMLHFPGERTLNSTEYQLYTRLQELLLEFSSIDIETKPLSLYEALRYFTQLAIDTSFQPQQTQKASIHVMGLLEAGGLHFDAVWVMGLNDKTWPAPAKPNPFIPYALQKKLGMPHSDAKKELHFAGLLMQQFMKANTHMIVSYAKTEGDTLYKPSPLITAFEKVVLPIEKTNDTITPIVLEKWLDDHADALCHEEILQGGARILQLQASCPFRAFAELRLKARPMDSPTLGISALHKGILIHSALEACWKAIKTHEMLLALDDAACHTIIHESVDSAFEKTFTVNFQRKNKQLLSIEKKRCVHLLKKWLALEKARPPFTVIAQETSRTLTLGALTLSLRMDRIDQLQNGKTMIIDYKTGKYSLANWFGKRPKEPQLPLYSLCDDKVGALAVGYITAQEVSYKGITEFPQESFKNFNINTIESLRYMPAEATWQDQMQTWKQDLLQLAEDFCKGLASVDPIDSDACEHCHLHSLCRIHEAPL